MPSAQDELVEELSRLERAGDLNAALGLLRARQLTPNALAAVALALYRRSLSAIAFLIVQMLLDNGIEHWTLLALSAHLGTRLGQGEAAARSTSRLIALFAAADADQRRSLRNLLDPLLPCDAVMAARSGNHALTRALAQLWAAAVPETTRRFAIPPADRPPDIARFREPGDPAQLHRFDAPPRGAPRIARKAVVAIRHLWIPAQPASREHDVPARIASALEAYGWQARRHDLRSLEDPAIVAADYAAIAALCRDWEADLLILDDFQPNRAGKAAGEIVRALRRERPQLKIAGLYMDPWVVELWGEIEAGAALLDCTWSPVVTDLWQRRAFAGKMLFATWPHGGAYPPPPPLQAVLSFGGGVQYSNWDRAFWLGAFAEAKLPLRIEVSDHAEDKLDPLASYRAYMLKAATGEAVLNFARRFNDLHTLTGRTFETLATGGLLIQERSDDIDRFFVANRHYLRFETLTDLFDIVHLLRAEPELAESIRREGAAFFQERYADDRLIAYLDHALFHRRAGK
ncbi:MAG TPA: glycosyltransferase, partial [Stellaceae bacterium]|nr:glycosyltransferase [Stellaceae bacterium]